MHCPQCGKKLISNSQRYCQACGADVATAGRTNGRTGGGASWRSSIPVPIVVKDTTMRTVLLVAAAVLLVPLALGALLATVAAGLALVGIVIHLAPVIAIGVIVYWLVNQRRRTVGAGR